MNKMILLLILMSTCIINAQDIINKLGKGGDFQIKHGNSDIMKISESNAVVNGQITVSDGESGYKLPAARDGESGVLKTDGGGNLRWSSDNEEDTQSIRFLICFNGEFPPNYNLREYSHSIGDIVMYAGKPEKIPSNFLECKGQLLPLRREYHALFALILNNYGGNGINNFRLPDFSGKSPANIVNGDR